MIKTRNSETTSVIIFGYDYELMARPRSNFNAEAYDSHMILDTPGPPESLAVRGVVRRIDRSARLSQQCFTWYPWFCSSSFQVIGQECNAYK